MEQDVFMDKQAIMSESGRKLHLFYYMTELRLMDNKLGYGIKVENVDSSEVVETGPITYSKQQIQNVCNLVIRNNVTTIGLIDAVDDLITGEMISVV